MMKEQTVSRADAKMIAETVVDLADKVLDWKARALAAEDALSKFAGEIYAEHRVTATPSIESEIAVLEQGRVG